MNTVGRSEFLFEGGHPVIPFLTAGFPNRRVFLDAAIAAYDSGAGALEIGMPFSDPLADGPAIQHSSQIALRGGITLTDVLDLTARLRARMDKPIFLMGYMNPILAMGLERFARRAADSGADGTIIPDCPLDEARGWIDISRKACLGNVFLIAPTTPDERIRRIDRMSTTFSYCVSVAGVTGARKSVASSTIAFLRRVRRTASKPFVVGFGISGPDQVRALRPYADGFVIGSLLVSVLDGARSRDAASEVGRTVRALVRAAG